MVVDILNPVIAFSFSLRAEMRIRKKLYESAAMPTSDYAAEIIPS
jgi:hypothetical protein